MTQDKTRKIAVSGMLAALIISLSGFYIPVGASKCFPVQHMVNVLAAVLLGPWWGVGIAFCASLIRNAMGTGTLLAFPGSMAGALCCGLVYEKTGRLLFTCGAEIFGTGVIGGLLAYPVALFLMGRPAALLGYVLPFLVSTAGGTVVAALLISVMEKSRVMDTLHHLLCR